MNMTETEQFNLDQHFMRLALKEAQKAQLHDEVPVGAVIIQGKGPQAKLISKSGNKRETLTTALGHAELIAVHRANKKLQTWRLVDCTLYVTLEPCFMCAGALVQTRIGRIVFGARDPKGGALVSLAELAQHPKLNHQAEVTAGVLEAECSQLLKDFFKLKRNTQTKN